LYLLFLH